MSAIKKFNLLIVGILLAFAGCFLYACGGPNYSKVTITASEQALFIDKNDEREITFTINNFSKGMDNYLVIDNDNSSKVSFERGATNGGQTTIRVTGLGFGTAHITASLEGSGKSCEVTVVVSEYATSISAGSDKLYVSESTPLVPSQANFNFDGGDKRDLDFYFYGISDNAITPEDITVSERYSQKFDSVKLIHQSNNYYLIFADGENLYTLSQPTIQNNVRLGFLQAQKSDDGAGKDVYTFDGAAQHYSVPLGQELTFMAIYRGAEESGIEQYFCERKFTVLGDIPSNVQYSYVYTNKDNEEFANQAVKLIPRADNNANTYQSATLKVEIPGATTLKDKAYYDNKIFKVEEGDERGENGIFTYVLTSAAQDTSDSVLTLKFFYPGLDGVNDESVNRTVKIDVNVIYQPESMTINGAASGEVEYVFYDRYNGDDGWQNLLVDLTPNDAVFDTLDIDFDDSVEMRHNGVKIESGYAISYKKGQVINLQIRGAKENASGQVTFTLNYNIVESKSITYTLNYVVKKGASEITATDESFLVTDDDEKGIFLASDISGPVTFSGLSADEEFGYATIRLIRGDDVVSISNETRISCDTQNGNALSMQLLPKKTGAGHYVVTLDNGIWREIVIRVVDTFKGFTFVSNEKNVAIDNIVKTDDTNYSVDAYILNTNTFDRTVNFSLNADAEVLSEAAFGSSESLVGFNRGSSLVATPSSLSFAVQTKLDGHGYVTLQFKISNIDGFKLIKSDIVNFRVNITSYSQIGALTINKTADGHGEYQNERANYAYVYHNTENYARRTATFLPSSAQGFLFVNPAYLAGQEGVSKYLYEPFSSQSIYWTTNLSSEIMYFDQLAQDHNFEIGKFGSFDAQKMSFTAYPNATNAEITLIANVMQLEQTYSFSIIIKIEEYVNVGNISLSTAIDDEENGHLQLYFSPNGADYHQELIVVTAGEEGKNPTLPSVSMIYTPANVTLGDETWEANFFDLTSEGISGVTKRSDGSYLIGLGSLLTALEGGAYLITLDCTQEFISRATEIEQSLTGTLQIVSDDWLDISGEILSKYSKNVITIDLNYQNGTTNNPFYLGDCEDVENIKNAPKANYIIARSIDVSQITQFPICPEFSGTIIGTKDYAEILNIAIEGSAEGGNLGLFGKVSGTINNVKFSGHISVTGAQSSNVGIIAGENSGKLINIGLTTNGDSQIDGNGNFGLVVGKNSGLISQDYLIYTDSAENNRFYSLNPRTLLYSDDEFAVTNAGSSNIGGVTGLNEGKIFKFDNDDLHLLNYGNYLAYASIKVNNAESETKAGIVAGHSTSSSMIAGGNAKGSDDAPKIYGKATVADGKVTEMLGGYNIGTGILVGGSVILNGQGENAAGTGYAGGVVGKIEAGENENFYGVTSRAYVRGGSSALGSSHIGAIAGSATFGTDFESIYTGQFEGEGSGLYSPFALQAVDDGLVGLDASMIVITLTTFDGDTAGTAPEINKIGFGDEYNDSVLAKTDGQDTAQNVFTYMERDKNELNGQQLELSSENQNDSSYFGDYVVVVKTDATKVYAQDFFEKGEELTTINPNDGFSSFDDENIFYAFYFAIASSVSGTQSIDSAQKILDQNYNTLRPSSQLYPFKILGDMQLGSLSTNIVSVNEMGDITIGGVGLASLRVSSLLNCNTERTIYLKCTNYFNDDKDRSIIYQSDNLTIPVGETQIQLKGNHVINFVVRPNLSLDEGEQSVFDIAGSGIVGGVAITLAPNTEIEICAEITSYTRVDGVVFKRQEGTLSSSDQEDLDQNAGLIPLDANNFGAYGGQSLTISRDDGTEEGEFHIHLWTRLKQNINNVAHYAVVNKDMSEENGSDEFTKIHYTPGADSIKSGHSSLPIYTSGDMQTYVIITSKSEEENPYLAVYDMETNELIKDLFRIVEYKDTSYVGAQNEQKFYLVISVNKDSDLYKNRATNNIYKTYRLTITAQSNTDVFVDIKLSLSPSQVKDMIIENYKTVSAISPTLVTLAGEQGLLAVNVQPYDADFDYIEITNDESSYEPGNGSANFNIVAKNRAGAAGFAQSNIGTVLTNGLRVTQKQITDFYASVDGSDNYLYNQYNGMFYIAYVVGTSSVVDGGSAIFNIAVYKNGQKVYDESIELKIELQYRIDMKLDAQSLDEGQYDVARGQTYRLDLDYYGFDFENIKLSLTSQDSRYLQLERDGNSYLVHVSDHIDYSGNSLGVTITAIGDQKEGDLVRHATESISLSIHEYVVRKTSLSQDFVEGMDGGTIHVQVGSSLTLAINPEPIIDYNPNIPDVVSQVREFVSALANSGKWTAYTNLNSSGYPPARPQQADKNAAENYKVTLPKADETNYYFTASGLQVTPNVTHDYFNNYYFFEYVGNYQQANNGLYSVVAEPEFDKTYLQLVTRFTLDVYQSSSLETPMPVENAEQLLAMEPNSHYRQVADITLPEDFEPITTQIASFDGNGYTIFYETTLISDNGQNSVYDFETGNIGLFDTIQSGTLIRNVTIALKNDVEFYTTAPSFTAGLLAGVNAGNISNCYAYSAENTLSVACLDLTSDAYAAGLVGRNSGYITNSRAQVNISSTFSIGGLVGQNSGVIASSYVRNVILDSSSNLSTHHVGGLAVVNDENGRISTSYVSGDSSGDRPYSNDQSHYLKSTQQQAGFVHTNLGSINDCYSNIYNDITNVTSNMAGFVFTNAGSIQNAFSLSVLKNNRDSSAGFVYDNEDTASYENCYYFYNERDKAGSDPAYGNINTTLHSQDIEGVQKLNKDGFANLENFDEFAHENSPTTTSVWCYSNNSERMSSLFSETCLVVNQADSSKPTSIQKSRSFDVGRLELVAPNMLAFSCQVVDHIVKDDATGDATYYYKRATGTSEGTANNPRLIASAQMLENYILESSSLTSNYNGEHYRLICDIDYNGLNRNSQLYKVTYYGVFEGNFMRINNVHLISTDQRSSAGLFGQIGRDASHSGTVMNLTLAPLEVTFVNTNCVGALAGTLSYGALYNVEVTKYTSDDDNESSNTNLAVQGKNFVGGVIGRAINQFTMKNITSNVSAVANYKPDGDLSYSTTASILGLYSYAGGVVGYAGGSGLATMHKIYSNGVTDLMGDRAGAIAGGIDSGTTADYLYATLSRNLNIKAYSYAGLAVGEIKGFVNHVQVGGAPKTNFFALIPEVPTAVGGIAGIMSGGSLQNAYMGQEFSVNNLIVDRLNGQEQTINVGNVGGLVGMVANGPDSKISNSVVAVSISAIADNLGGLIGQSSSDVSISNVAMRGNVDLKFDMSVQGATAANESARISTTAVGGFIGRSSGYVSIENSYSLASLNVIMHSYNAPLTSSVGHFVGIGIPGNMTNVYSTGAINVTLADKRSSEELSQVTSGSSGLVTYDRKLTSTGFTNVKFYGTGSYSGSTYNELTTIGMTDFKQKSLHYKIALNANYLGAPVSNVLTEFNSGLDANVWNSGASSDTHVPLVMENTFDWLIQMNFLTAE